MLTQVYKSGQNFISVPYSTLIRPPAFAKRCLIVEKERDELRQVESCDEYLH